MIGLFHKKKYWMRRDGHRLYIKWLRPINEWTSEDCDEYQKIFRRETQKTVDAEEWLILTEGKIPKSEDPEYQRYVESIRDKFVREYGLDAATNEVRIGLYHGDCLVICFVAPDGIEFPDHYCGIQLKQLKKGA